MNTKEHIIESANRLLIERGFNAFSYKTISQEIAIKTSSIHYHFPAKCDLGIAIIKRHQQALDQTIAKINAEPPLEKLNKLFLYYRKLAVAQKVCIVGAFTSDINTLDEPLRQELLLFAHSVIDWTASILDEGQDQQLFKPIDNTPLKAKLLIANLMSMVQIARIEKSNGSFDEMTEMLLQELICRQE